MRNASPRLALFGRVHVPRESAAPASEMRGFGFRFPSSGPRAGQWHVAFHRGTRVLRTVDVAGGGEVEMRGDFTLTKEHADGTWRELKYSAHPQNGGTPQPVQPDPYAASRAAVVLEREAHRLDLEARQVAPPPLLPHEQQATGGGA